MTGIDETKVRLPSAGEVRKEGGRLHDTLESLIKLAEDAAYDEEIARMCNRLEEAGSEDPLDDILELKDVLKRDELDVGVDIEKELEHAWMLDQLSLLEARGRTLDDVSGPHLMITILKFITIL